MKKTLWIVAILLLSPFHGLIASERGDVEILHYESLDDLSFGRDQFRWLPGSREAKPTSMAFHALGRRFALELQPNERLLTQAFRGRVPDGVGVYRGRLAGQAGSWVRLVVSNGVPSGLVWDGEQMFAIEPQPGLSGTDAPVIYRLRDVYVEPGTMSCGTSSAPAIDFATVYEDITAELNEAVVAAAGELEQLNVGVVGDFEFTHILGDSAEAELLARINNVDGIFSEQLGVQITAREVDTFQTVTDPFTRSDPSGLLEEISRYRQTTPAQADQGITFLFTGRDLDGTTVGLAYRGALCAEQFGVGLGEARRGVATDSLIAAHEIGHLFGAQHDGEAGSVCESVTGTFLMSPRVSDTSEFSSCSIETIQPYIDSARCINPVLDADVAVELNGGIQNLLLGDTVDLNFDVVNNGTLDATTVAVSIDIPSNLTLNSITATAGSCTSGAGQADCALGTIAGLGTERVTVGVTAGSVGSSTVNATVSADSDSQPGNNTATGTVTVSAVSSSATDDSDSGGGAVNLLWLMLLVLVRRRFHPAP